MSRPRHHYEERLQNLYRSVEELGAKVEIALRNALKALEEADEALASRVIDGDREIDDQHREIEDEATRIMATEQPVATDLRELVATIKIAGDLERIGDHARHLSKAVTQVPRAVVEVALPSVLTMADIGIGMVHDSLIAFLEQDSEAAKEIASRDDRIDAEHRVLYEKLIRMMAEHTEWIEHGIHMMFLNRFLERLGDHVTNMCEWVVFARTGGHEELNP